MGKPQMSNTDKRILVVEDELLISKITKRTLEKLGYTVTSVVVSGEEAIERAKKDSPDLILMDILLKGEIDGITAAGDIKPQLDIPIVYLSSSADEEKLRRAKKTEPFGYLIKPFDELVLHSTIEMALYKHRMEQKLKEKEKEWVNTFNSITDFISVHDRDFRIVNINKSFAEFLGKRPEELIGKNCHEIFHDSKIPMGNCLQINILKTKEPVTEEIYEPKIDRYLMISASPIFNKDCEVKSVVHYIKDITEYRKIEMQIRKNEALLRDIVVRDQTAIVITAIDGTVRFLNPAAKALFDQASEESIGRKLAYNVLDGDITRVEITQRNKEIRTAEMRTVEVEWEGEKNILVWFTDITERKRMEDELEKLAITDKLTGAYNRTKFDEIMEREIDRAKRYNKPLTLMMYDIDYFKKVNDMFGHSVGDYVLKTVVNIVNENMRAVDYLMRWGGEEFIIISPESDKESGVYIANRMRKVVENHRFENAGKVTVSFGVTEFKGDDDEDSLLKRVDDAMYKAKQNGRNRVEML